MTARCHSGDRKGYERISMSHREAADQKRGYLKTDFAFFHLRDMKNLSFEYHYHDFYKILVFLSGNVTYLIEGSAYRLKPWDILFISSSELHRPIIDPSSPYERLVIWIDPGFLEKHSEESDLRCCFLLSEEHRSSLLRLGAEGQKAAESMLCQLESAYRDGGFGAGILKNSILLQLLVTLTRSRLGAFRENSSDGQCSDWNGSGAQADPGIRRILEYINHHPEEDLTIDSLSDRFFISRYHLMHKFKQQTGYPVHSYILQKRLIKADLLIRGGTPAHLACEGSGFHDYSSFVRAYRKLFGVPPSKRAR